jgi:hypothetical protein
LYFSVGFYFGLDNDNGVSTPMVVISALSLIAEIAWQVGMGDE